MSLMFFFASAFNQPVSFDTVEVTNVSVYQSLILNYRPVGPFFSLFLCTYHQLNGMFNSAAAFNQPVNFNTTKVEDVRVYLF